MHICYEYIWKPVYWSDFDTITLIIVVNGVIGLLVARLTRHLCIYIVGLTVY